MNRMSTELSRAAFNRKKKPVRIGRVIFVVSFIILPTVNFFLFYVFVNLNSFVMAFQLTTQGVTRWTLDNFTRFFG
ncbi:MAG: hypothetical protein FWE62_02080, partial [Firmicutes bacterium]|nr:hypothetical protein [Bacillota bacterium]